MLYVNGERIEEEHIQDEADRLRPDHDRVFADMPPEERELQLLGWSRENVIEQTLLRQAALRDPEAIPAAEVDKHYQDLLQEQGDTGPAPSDEEEVKNDILERLRIERFVDRLAGDIAEPSDEGIKEYYESNLDRFTHPEVVKARHIIKHYSAGTPPSMLKKKLSKVLKKLQEGADFKEEVGKHSDCPDNDGDLGYFPRGQMVKEFDEAVFDLKPGAVSHVFQTDFGFHIALVEEKRPPTLCSLEETREIIIEEVKNTARQKALEEFLDAEKEKATIEEKEEPCNE